MKNLIKYSVLGLALVLSAAPKAHADGLFDWLFGNHGDKGGNTAPEIDPGLAMSGIALLAGTLTVARAKRAK